MNTNLLYLIVGALVAAVAVLGYSLYQEQHKSGVSVEVGGKDILHMQAK
jgi:predicted negative regulator of RcsB-dependent stress response